MSTSGKVYSQIKVSMEIKSATPWQQQVIPRVRPGPEERPQSTEKKVASKLTKKLTKPTITKIKPTPKPAMTVILTKEHSTIPPKVASLPLQPF